MNEVEKIEGVFLQDLFDSFRAAQVGYCVLRNYHTLPESLGGSDLDLAVLPEQKQFVADIIIAVAARYHGVPIVDYVSSGRFIRILGCFNHCWWGVAIDLFWMMEYRGVEYIPSHQVIDRSKDYKGIKVARDEDAATIALVKELLSNGKTRKNYFPLLVEQYQCSGENALHLLKGTFDKITIQYFVSLLAAQDEKQEHITKLTNKLRKDVLCLGGSNQIEGMVRNFLWRLHRLVKPAGVSIAVLGTDGSGKTTLIDKIRPVLERAIHNEIQYEHLRPNWLPALGVATGKREAGNGEPVTNPHEQKPSGFLGSLIRLGYYTLDYGIGYWIAVYPRLVKRPHICLFDRYYYDFMIDPRRMRIALPKWLMRLVFFFSPRPRIVLCLGANPEVLFKRKPETSQEEVSRQIDELKALCLSDDRAYWIDTEKNPEKSAHDMLNLIKGSMSSRYF